MAGACAGVPDEEPERGAHLHPLPWRMPRASTLGHACVFF
jgi:hypothetical protein